MTSDRTQPRTLETGAKDSGQKPWEENPVFRAGLSVWCVVACVAGAILWFAGPEGYSLMLFGSGLGGLTGFIGNPWKQLAERRRVQRSPNNP